MTMIGTNYPDSLDRNFRAVFAEFDLGQPLRIAPLTEIDSTVAYEKESGVGDLPIALAKGEGADVQYRDPSQLYDKTYTHSTIALGTKISWELLSDAAGMQAIVDRATALRNSVLWKINQDVGNLWNRATNAAFPGPDGVPLCDPNHPSAGGGVRLNEVAVAAAFSYDSIEDTILALMAQTSYEGQPLGYSPPFTLVTPLTYLVDANELLGSALRPAVQFADTEGTTTAVATAYNNNNVVRGLVSGLYAENPYITINASFIVAGGHKLRFFWRERPALEGPIWDPDNLTWKYVAYARYSLGWSDWKQVYMQPHA